MCLRTILLGISTGWISLCGPVPARSADPATTSTPWRDDGKNIDVTRKLNEAYLRMPFSREFEGVLDDCPMQLEWSVGPNLPRAWKGGVAGFVGDELVLAGGLWMPGRLNSAYAYNVTTETFGEIPPPPERPAYTQGACDGESLYIVGGRATGRRVFKLTREGENGWTWQDLPQLPEAESGGRWVGTVGIVPGKWLFLVAGHPTGTPAEIRTIPALPDYALRLDEPTAAWRRIAPYPGGPRAVLMSAVVRGMLYVFGGSYPEPTMRKIHLELTGKAGFASGINAPFNGVPNYRDAYRYDPEHDRWTALRRTPFPVLAGDTIVLKDRYVLLMGSADVRSHRVGETQGSADPFWRGYGDRILCYDVEQDNYSHVGVMLYGVATTEWVTDGERIWGFGGEPAHNFTSNTENVLQIATIKWLP
jgi:hypothetical protein